MPRSVPLPSRRRVLAAVGLSAVAPVIGKAFGADRFWVTAPWADLGPEETGVRTEGRTWSGVDRRLRELERFKQAVGDDF